jgi:hypothetical protein
LELQPGIRVAGGRASGEPPVFSNWGLASSTASHPIRLKKSFAARNSSIRMTDAGQLHDNRRQFTQELDDGFFE